MELTYSIDQLGKDTIIKEYKDYHSFRNKPIIIDNGSNKCFILLLIAGSWQCRVGYGNEDEPRLQYNNVIAKTRERKSGKTVVVVGDEALYEKTSKTPFELGTNVVVNSDMMENSLDFIFSQLGVEGQHISNPVLMTEPVCNPAGSRAITSELLFEAYGVPCVAYGIDALFATEMTKTKFENGIIVSFGHVTTHVIPILNGKWVQEHTKSVRISIGGHHTSDYLLKLLQYKYPTFPVNVIPLQAQHIVHNHCYVASDYMDELKQFSDISNLSLKEHIIEFPFSPVDSDSKAEDLDEIERRKEAQRERLREQVKKSREERLAGKESELEKLKSLLEIKQEDPDDYLEHWKANGFAGEEDLENAMKTLEEDIRKIKNKILGIEEVSEKPKEKPDFSLVNVPDSELTPEEIKEKRKQRLLKAGWDARERMRQEKEAAKLKQEAEEREDEEKRLTNPEEWLVKVHEKRAVILERLKERKKKTEMLSNRKNQISQSRLKIMAALMAEDNSKSGRSKKRRMEEDDGFGADDKDWMVYHEIKENEEDDEEDDQQKLEHYENLLLQYDPNFIKEEDLELEKRKKSIYYRLRYGPQGFHDPNDIRSSHQLRLNVERVRVPEVLFQPSMLGLEQAGLIEVLHTIIQQFGRKEQDKLINNILLTGTHSLYPGLKERLAAELTMLMPNGAKINIYLSGNAKLDAWKGAAKVSADKQMYMSKAEYEEYGAQPSYCLIQRFEYEFCLNSPMYLKNVMTKRISEIRRKDESDVIEIDSFDTLNMRLKMTRYSKWTNEKSHKMETRLKHMGTLSVVALLIPEDNVDHFGLYYDRNPMDVRTARTIFNMHRIACENPYDGGNLRKLRNGDFVLRICREGISDTVFKFPKYLNIRLRLFLYVDELFIGKFDASRIVATDLTLMLFEDKRNKPRPLISLALNKFAKNPEMLKRMADTIRDEHDGDCNLCLDELRMSDVAISDKCGHWAHERCLKEWLRTKGFAATCPFCREKLYDLSLNDVE